MNETYLSSGNFLMELWEGATSWVAVLVALAALCTFLAGPAWARAKGTASTQVSIYASPSGKEDNSGLEVSKPVPLLRAQLLARREIVAGRAPLVLLEAGTYRLSVPLAFGPQDSGPSTGNPTIYRAATDKATGKVERVVLTGSRLVTGKWQPVDGKIFRIYVGKGSEGVLFRQIYMGGERGVRARSALMPEGGLVSAAEVESVHGARRESSGEDASGYHLVTPLHLDPAEIKEGTVELVSLEEWKSMRCPITALSPDGLTITLQQPCWNIATHVSANNPTRQPRITWFENALEFVRRPGDWYHDRSSGYLYYYPRNPAELKSGVEIPRLENLIAVHGSSSASVRNLTVADLTFEYTDWTGPERFDGYITIQGGIIAIPCATCRTGKTATTLEGAVDVADAEGVTVTDNQFQDLGGSAIHLAASTRNISLLRNDIHDVAGDGIFVGGWSSQPPPPSDNKTPYCEDDTIADNTIRSIGLDYSDSDGIWVGICRHMTVEYNTLRDLPQLGISVGWGFSYKPNVGLGANRIYRNKIENIMQMLIDGGGIYTQSDQADPTPAANSTGTPQGTVIEENFIDGVGLGLRVGDAFAVRTNMKTAAVAIYNDHGSSYMDVVNNVYDHIPQEPFGLTPPIFGDQDTSFRMNGYESPCKFRACAIHDAGNHAFNRKNKSDLEIERNAGARVTAGAADAGP